MGGGGDKHGPQMSGEAGSEGTAADEVLQENKPKGIKKATD